MITQVLAHHPTSANAHCVQAELYAREGKISLARAELGSAERLNPGLTEFKPSAVQELKSELGLNPALDGAANRLVSGALGVAFPLGRSHYWSDRRRTSDDAVSSPHAL